MKYCTTLWIALLIFTISLLHTAYAGSTLEEIRAKGVLTEGFEEHQRPTSRRYA